METSGIESTGGGACATCAGAVSIGREELMKPATPPATTTTARAETGLVSVARALLRRGRARRPSDPTAEPVFMEEMLPRASRALLPRHENRAQERILCLPVRRR